MFINICAADEQQHDVTVTILCMLYKYWCAWLGLQYNQQNVTSTEQQHMRKDANNACPDWT